MNKSRLKGPGVDDTTARAAAYDGERDLHGADEVAPVMRSPPGPITAVMAEKIRAANESRRDDI